MSKNISYITEFKKKSLEQRTAMYQDIKKRYPNRYGIIVSKRDGSQAPDITKHKYLVPDDLSISQLIYVFRKRIQVKETQGIFFFIDNVLLSSSNNLIGGIYNQYKDKDGFLYVIYDVENTFG